MAEDAPGWEAGWESSRRAQLEAQAAATPAQRLAWLEEALRLALAAGALPRPVEAAPEEEPGGQGTTA
jgi:hypothetical protein